MNEVFKAEMFRFFKSKVWLFYLVIVSLVSLFLITSISEKDQAEWKNDLKTENVQLQHAKDSSSRVYDLNSLYLKKNIQPPTSSTFTGYMSSVLSLRGLGLLIVIFPIVIAAGIAKDLENKRMNFILTSPITRSTYFYGRLFSILVITLLLLACILTINLLIALFYFKDTSVYDVVYYIKGDQILSSSGLSYILSNIFCSLPYYLTYSVIAYSLATIFKSSVISLSVTLLFALLGTQLVSGLGIVNTTTLFVLPAIIDITKSIAPENVFQASNYTVWLALFIIVCYVVLFTMLWQYSFKKADI